jgi:hypothetical protein
MVVEVQVGQGDERRLAGLPQVAPGAGGELLDEPVGLVVVVLHRR